MSRCIFSVLWVAVLVAAMIVAGALPAFAKPPRDPSQTVSDAGGSNLGVCSSYLGRQQVRDDVKRIINSGAIPGIVASLWAPSPLRPTATTRRY